MYQGQSIAASKAKAEALTEIFTHSMAAATNCAKKLYTKHWLPYIHIDLNVGSGYNELSKTDGSGIIFINVAAKFKTVKYVTAFLDDNKKQIDEMQKRLELRKQLRQNNAWGCFCTDNKLFLQNEIIASNGFNDRLGSILSDPNGADVPVNELSKIAEICPRLDIIFHWNANITKRLKFGIKPEQIVINDVPNLIYKKQWLIREKVGPHEFTFLIGRNYAYKNLYPNFHDLYSKRGQEISYLLSTSKRSRSEPINLEDFGL